MKKLRVGILFGGRSGEHEVSLLSAASVLNAIDRKKFDVVPIGITKEGRWLTATDAERLLAGEPPREPRKLRAGDPATTAPAAVLAHGDAARIEPVPSPALIPFQAASSAKEAIRLDGQVPRRQSSPFSTAPSAKTAPSRDSSNSPASPTSAPASSAPPPAWTRT